MNGGSGHQYFGPSQSLNQKSPELVVTTTTYHHHHHRNPAATRRALQRNTSIPISASLYLPILLLLLLLVVVVGILSIHPYHSPCPLLVITFRSQPDQTNPNPNPNPNPTSTPTPTAFERCASDPARPLTLLDIFCRYLWPSASLDTLATETFCCSRQLLLPRPDWARRIEPQQEKLQP